MEKQDELKAFARMCVQSLADDAMLWTCSIGAGGHEGFRVSRSFNMLCLFVALLLFFGCILRPVAELREHYYASKETIVIPLDGAENLEEKAIRKSQERLIEKINSTKSIDKTN